MTAHHIPDVILERYRLDELPPADAARVAEELARDPQLAARMKALDASDTALGPAVELSAARLAGRAPVRSRLPMWTIPATAAAAFVLLAVVLRMDRSGAVPSDERIKGAAASAPTLALYRRTPDGSERLADGSIAHPGDLIRVGYRAGGHTHGVIVSIDGAGNLTMHLPAAGDRATALQQTKSALLDQAYELDDAPRWERFYFVAGDSAFEIAPIVRAAKEAARTDAGTASGALRLPRGLQQASFTLLKESRR